MVIKYAKLRGFSLVELVATLAIAGLMLAIAVPNFQHFIENSRASTLSNDFVAAINLARTQAVKRATTVTICPAAGPTATRCSEKTDWAQGYIVFVDRDNRGVIAQTTDRLLVHLSLSQGQQMRSDTARIRFTGNGFVAEGAGRFTVAPAGCTGSHGRDIQLNATGHVAVTPCACPSQASTSQEQA